jgi:L-histidine N-alpha-methyltransferase
MGSSIGNFNRLGAEEFLMGLFEVMKSNDKLMIMFDLRKNYKTIQKAYDDPKGISSSF